MSTKSLFLIVLFLLGLLSIEAMQARRHISKILVAKKSGNGNQNTAQSYVFPGLLDYAAPTEVQPCSYFTDLQTQFATAMSEIQSITAVYDQVPGEIEETFSEMKQNFTEYNAKSNNDQLEQDILDNTQSVIDKAPNLLTVSQKAAYYSNLQTGLDTVNDYLNNGACSFTASIKVPDSEKYLCVSADGSVTATDSDLLLDNCEQFQFFFTGFETTDQTVKTYCIASIYNGNYLTVDQSTTDNSRLVNALGISCYNTWRTSDTKQSDYYNFEADTGYLSKEDDNSISANKESASDSEKFTLKID